MSWLVVATKPLQEARAETNLRRQAVEVYCPRIKSFGKIKALFPSYLFAKPQSDEIGFIQNTFGVRSLVRVGGELAKVCDHEIQDIRSREDKGIVVLESQYCKGDKMTWGSIPVIFEQMLDSERCYVLFSMLGRTRHKILYVDQLAPDLSSGAVA